MTTHPSVRSSSRTGTDTWVERRMDGRDVAAIFESGPPIRAASSIRSTNRANWSSSPSVLSLLAVGRRGTGLRSEARRSRGPLSTAGDQRLRRHPVGAGYSVHVTDDAGRTIGVTDAGFTVDAISDPLRHPGQRERPFVMDAEGFSSQATLEVPCTIDGESGTDSGSCRFTPPSSRIRAATRRRCRIHPFRLHRARRRHLSSRDLAGGLRARTGRSSRWFPVGPPVAGPRDAQRLL